MKKMSRHQKCHILKGKILVYNFYFLTRQDINYKIHIIFVIESSALNQLQTCIRCYTYYAASAYFLKLYD